MVIFRWGWPRRSRSTVLYAEKTRNFNHVITKYRLQQHISGYSVDLSSIFYVILLKANTDVTSSAAREQGRRGRDNARNEMIRKSERGQCSVSPHSFSALDPT
jgi:hypothetical protein